MTDRTPEPARSPAVTPLEYAAPRADRDDGDRAGPRPPATHWVAAAIVWLACAAAIVALAASAAAYWGTLGEVVARLVAGLIVAALARAEWNAIVRRAEATAAILFILSAIAAAWCALAIGAIVRGAIRSGSPRAAPREIATIVVASAVFAFVAAAHGRWALWLGRAEDRWR